MRPPLLDRYIPIGFSKEPWILRRAMRSKTGSPHPLTKVKPDLLCELQGGTRIERCPLGRNLFPPENHPPSHSQRRWLQRVSGNGRYLGPPSAVPRLRPRRLL